MEERRAVAEILGTQEGETNIEAAQRTFAELQRILSELKEIAELKRGPLVHPATDPVIDLQDNDPSDPRPAMHPLLGWRTPEVEAWVQRRNHNNA